MKINDRVVVTAGPWADEHGSVVSQGPDDYLTVVIDHSNEWHVQVRADRLVAEEGPAPTKTYAVKVQSEAGQVNYKTVQATSTEHARELAITPGYEVLGATRILV